MTDCGEDVDEDSITIKEEVVSRYKEGMEVTPRPDGRAPEPPEGFSIYTTESGVMVLRRKRQRNLQRLGKLFISFLYINCMIYPYFILHTLDMIIEQSHCLKLLFKESISIEICHKILINFFFFLTLKIRNCC